MSRPPRVNSLFSGVGTFDHGFALAGWETVSLCEWDAQARRVLQARFPGVPLSTDVRTVMGAELPHAEALMFGSPCQDLSISGRSARAGLEGDRSGLFREAIRIIQEQREATDGQYPTFALWENVPGALSSNRGRDFAAVLRAFLELGAHDLAWRVLDAQHFGVPQRRKRLFLVADFGGERAQHVLFEPEGLRGHSAAFQNPRPDVASAPVRGVDAPCIGLNVSRYGDDAQLELAPTLRVGSVAGVALRMSDGRYAVRRHTPVELERLQGMPDGWTGLPGLPDGPRQRFMGNGGAAPLLRWIAGRMRTALALRSGEVPLGQLFEEFS